MKSSARTRSFASRAAWPRSWMSLSICRGAFGRWTLTATRLPFGSTARCTWPIEAAASAWWSNSRKRRSIGSPRSSRTTRSTSANGNGRTSSCRPRSSATTSGGTMSGRVERSWPNLTNVGPSSSSISRKWRPRAVPPPSTADFFRPSRAYPNPCLTATWAISLSRPRLRCFGRVATRSVLHGGTRALLGLRHFPCAQGAPARPSADVSRRQPRLGVLRVDRRRRRARDLRFGSALGPLGGHLRRKRRDDVRCECALPPSVMADRAAPAPVREARPRGHLPAHRGVVHAVRTARAGGGVALVGAPRRVDRRGGRDRAQDPVGRGAEVGARDDRDRPRVDRRDRVPADDRDRRRRNDPDRHRRPLLHARRRRLRAPPSRSLPALVRVPRGLPPARDRSRGVPVRGDRLLRALGQRL